MNRLLSIIPFFLLLSCINTNGQRNLSSETSRIEFNLSLIHTLSSHPTSGDIHPNELPYYAVYKREGHTLIYLTTDHTSNVNSKTHLAIDKIMTELSPEQVIVEVPPYEDELSNEVLNHCDLSKKCVEGLYAYKKAKKLGIKVLGGEPPHIEVLKTSLANGLSKKEILFFYTFRGVASWRQGDPSRTYTPENPTQEIRKYIKGNKKRLQLENIDFNYDDFVSIYEKNMKKAFNYKDTRYNDIAPYRDGHYIQKLSVAVDKAREESILKKTEDVINKNKKVFIIYGSGHYLKHRPVLSDAFQTEDITPLQ